MFWKHSCFLRAINAAIFILLLGSGVSFAQKVPPPEEILGFKIGIDLHLATYQQAIEYFRMLEKASLKIKLFEIGKTSIGKPMIYAIITSAENMANLDRFKNISKRLSLAKGLTDKEVHALTAKGRLWFILMPAFMPTNVLRRSITSS